MHNHRIVSSWITRFSTGDISCLDEPRPGRPLSNSRSPLQHFSEKYTRASAWIIAMHFNVSHTAVKDILSRELGFQKPSRRWVRPQSSEAQRKLRADTSVEWLPCSINILSYSLMEMRWVMSHGSFALRNRNQYTNEGARRSHQGEDLDFRSRKPWSRLF